MNLTVSALSESELLARIFPHLGTNEFVELGPGDDCAVVAAPAGRFVVSTDVLVQDAHFSMDWSTGFEVGWRAAMQNLSDISAMGAVPSSLVVGLAMPPATEVSWMEDFARGLAAASRVFGAAVVGGDLSSGPAVFISVTVHGHMGPGLTPIRRSGAQVGDVVAHCGLLGWSAAGLAQLSENEPSHTEPDHSDGRDNRAGNQNRRKSAEQLFRTPMPPVGAGERAARAGAHALMDVSDSLVRDAGRMGRASAVVLELDADAVLAHGDWLDPAYARWEDGVPESMRTLPQDLGILPAHNQAQRLERKLIGGEDHGLIATFAANVDLPAGFKPIGRVRGIAVDNERSRLAQGGVTVTGVDMDALGEGWDHFR